jgi:hypothetical protein
VLILGVYGGSIPAGSSETIHDRYQEMQFLLQGMKGVWVEDKTACFAVHYRDADRATIRRARRLVRKRLPAGMQIRPGKCVWDIVPAEAVNEWAKPFSTRPMRGDGPCHCGTGKRLRIVRDNPFGRGRSRRSPYPGPGASVRAKTPACFQGVLCRLNLALRSYC